MVERKKAGNHGIFLWDNFPTNPLTDGEILLAGETTWISTYCKTLQNVKYVLKSSDNVSLVFFSLFGVTEDPIVILNPLSESPWMNPQIISLNILTLLSGAKYSSFVY